MNVFGIVSYICYEVIHIHIYTKFVFNKKNIINSKALKKHNNHRQLKLIIKTNLYQFDKLLLIFSNLNRVIFQVERNM